MIYKNLLNYRKGYYFVKIHRNRIGIIQFKDKYGNILTDVCSNIIGWEHVVDGDCYLIRKNYDDTISVIYNVNKRVVYENIKEMENIHKIGNRRSAQINTLPF